jgi:hypothetical protein
VLAALDFHELGYQRPTTAVEVSLADHLVGAGEQRGRECQADSLSGLVIDHQLELPWVALSERLSAAFLVKFSV